MAEGSSDSSYIAGLDPEKFREYGKQMVDFVADYYCTIRTQSPYPKPDIQPGYLPPKMPTEAPQDGEEWSDIMRDVEKLIYPGMTHWQHPNFHAYFPALTSFPAICADMLSGTLSCIGFTWASSPACTELEVVVMDWLAKAVGLPDIFLHSSRLGGGGVIQHTASDATYVALLAARNHVLHENSRKPADERLTSGQVHDKLVAYCSSQAHSSVERATLLANVKIRYLATDDQLSVRGPTLEKALKEDKEKGLIPFFVCCTLGTTNACSFDNLEELGVVCAADPMVWLHVDAAYAGSAFICPEFRAPLAGVESCDSYNFNPHKWLLVNFDCSAMWVKSSARIAEAFDVDPLYLKHENQGKMPDFRHWHIPLGRRFRSLKLWFVLRAFGISGLQKHIRRHVRLAEQFEDLIKDDSKLEIFGKPILGLVCFKIKDADNALNEKLLKMINDDRRLHMVPSKINGVYFLRFAVCSVQTTSDDITFAYDVISELTNRVLSDKCQENGAEAKMAQLSLDDEC